MPVAACSDLSRDESTAAQHQQCEFDEARSTASCVGLGVYQFRPRKNMKPFRHCLISARNLAIRNRNEYR